MLGKTNIANNAGKKNYKIIKSLSQPSAPSNNTIWVETENFNNSWSIDNVEPQDISTWIKIDTKSQVSFNPLESKNCEIEIPLGQASEKQNSKWKKLNGFLYNNGWQQFSKAELDALTQGDYTFKGGTSIFTPQSGKNWMITFKSSGKLTFKNLNNAEIIDIFCVGGGAHGAPGVKDSNQSNGSGGAGGLGGDCITKTSVELEEGKTYTITIGGSGGSSSFGNLVTATSGKTKSTVQGFDGKAYGGQGKKGYKSGSDNNQPAGGANTGQGGGGGNYGWLKHGNGSSGGSGIIIIRNHRA